MKKIFFVTTLFLLSISANTQIAEQLSENYVQNIDTELFNLKRKYVMETMMKNIPEVTADFEIVDRSLFRRGMRIEGTDTLLHLGDSYTVHNKDRSRSRSRNRQRSVIRGLWVSERDIVEEDFSINPLFGVFKRFYPTGGIQEKGVLSDFGFRMGLWYHFDEEGKLVEVVDHDKGFEFTAVDVLAYALATDIDLERRSSGSRTPMARISKRTDAENNPIWIIDSTLVSDHLMAVVVRIDGKTGRVIERREFEEHIIF